MKLKETRVIQPSSSPTNEIPDPDPTPAAEKQTTTVTTSAPDFAPPQEHLAEATSEPSNQPGMTAAEEIPAVQSVSDALEVFEVSEASGPKVDSRPHEPSSESEAIPHVDVTTHGCSAGNVLKSFRDGVSFHVDDSGLVDSEDEERSNVLGRHNVRILGEGEELLFMAHGFGTNQQIWGGVLDKFDLKEYKVILYDLMGAYSTDPEDFDCQRYSTLHGYADDLLEVLEALGVQSCTYIGASVSGMIGFIASIERPEIFKRLIVMGASPRYLDEGEYVGGFTVDALDQVFVAMQDNYKAWISGFAPMVVGEDVESASVRELSRTLFLIRPDIAYSTLKTIFMCDLRHLLPQVTVQVHVLQTAQDNAVPWEVCEYMLHHIPNAFAEVLPVEGHLPHLTHPLIVREALLSHLAMPIRPTGNIEVGGVDRAPFC